MSKDPKKVSHRDKFLCANCLYSGKCTYAAPRTCRVATPYGTGSGSPLKTLLR